MRHSMLARPLAAALLPTALFIAACGSYQTVTVTASQRPPSLSSPTATTVTAPSSSPSMSEYVTLSGAVNGSLVGVGPTSCGPLFGDTQVLDGGALNGTQYNVEIDIPSGKSGTFNNQQVQVFTRNADGSDKDVWGTPYASVTVGANHWIHVDTQLSYTPAYGRPTLAPLTITASLICPS